jgi:two-component system, NarL family, nitrate/nitrite response regulator NarL
VGGSGGHASLSGVLVIVGVRLYREGIAAALLRAGYLVAAMVADETAALGILNNCRPSVAVLDAHGAGLATVRRLRRRAPQMRVIVLAIRGGPNDVLAWAEAGIAGYVTIDDSLDRLVDVVGAAVRGEAYCTPAVSGALLEHVHRLAAGRPDPPAVASLTSREREIARCLCDGMSNKEIAARLVIALPTVKNHVHHILGKLEVTHRADAAQALHAVLD